MHPLLEQVDWEQEGKAVVELLRALLRFDTTNPPGNEAECVEFLADTLRGAGVEPEVLPAGPTWSPACPAATVERRRCCSTVTSTWSRPRPGAGGTRRSPARSTTASSGAGARST